MPHVISDIVDVYVFRRLNARVQFLLLQRKSDVTLPHTWQSFHTQIRAGETTIEAARRAVDHLAGLNVHQVFSADYVNQFYDDGRDALILAPVFAVNVSPQAPIDLGDDFRDAAWFDRDEATARLPFSGQRWAVRHIDEIMGLGEAEAGIYHIDFDLTPIPPRDTDGATSRSIPHDDRSNESTDYSFGPPVSDVDDSSAPPTVAKTRPAGAAENEED